MRCNVHKFAFLEFFLKVTFVEFVELLLLLVD